MEKSANAYVKSSLVVIFGQGGNDIDRYLLFDSECAACSALAQSIEGIVGDYLRVCSLHHQPMITFLDRVNPNWAFEPTLLEVEGTKVRMFTGLSLAIHLARVIGPRKAFQLARLAASTLRPQHTKVKGLDASRRGFLVQSMALIGWLVLPKHVRVTASKAVPPSRPSFTEIGELYGGFVLLPDGAPEPADLTTYLGFPNPCGAVELGGKEHAQASDAVEVKLSDAKSLAMQSGFPLYTLRTIPSGLSFPTSRLIKHGSGDVHGSDLSYKAFDSRFNTVFTAISITAQKGFPRPYPLWYQSPVEENGPSIILEKVAYVPGGEGILINTPVGFDLHWIQYDILYSLSLEHFKGIGPKEVSSLLEMLT